MKTALLTFCLFCQVINAYASANVPILLYHRCKPVVNDAMTVTPATFESQLKWLQDNHYTVISLKSLVAYLQDTGAPPPSKSVVITIDDGHKSVYTAMFPLISKYHVPVTLFIYPTAISHATNAMTWEELQELQKTGLFDIQSHTYSHPNFKKEKRSCSAADYWKFIDKELISSKESLEKKFGNDVDMLAWPFGIYDEMLEQEATKIGYVAAFTIKRHNASKADAMTALPRYIILDSDGTKNFAKIASGRAAENLL